jgi:hypothetical protein
MLHTGIYISINYTYIYLFIYLLHTFIYLFINLIRMELQHFKQNYHFLISNFHRAMNIDILVSGFTPCKTRKPKYKNYYYLQTCVQLS